MISLFTPKSPTRLFHLQNQLQNIKKGQKSVDDYLREIQLVCDQMQSIGHHVSDEMKCFSVFRGLDRDYESFVTSQSAFLNYSGALSFESLSANLKDFDDRLAMYSSMTTQSTMAFNASKNPSQVSNQSDNRAPNNPNSGRGFGRGRSGYSTRGRGFHQHINQQTQGPHLNQRPICQLCGKYGHVVAKCWHRFDNNFHPTESPTAMYSAVTPPSAH